MDTLTKGLLIVLAGMTLAAGGCYGSAMSVARCAAKYKAREAIERDFTPGSTLEVRNDFGPISVTGGSETGCRILGRVYVRAPTKRESQELGEQVRIVAEPNDGILMVTVTRPDVEGDRSMWVDLEIVVPSHARVDCETEFGRIKIVGIEGDVRARTNFGPITCTKITSGNIDVQTEFGGICVTCEDDSPADMVADARTEYGKIRFRAPKAFDGGIDLGTEFGSTGAKISRDARDRWTRGHKTGSTGSGAGRLFLHTEFGSVRLR